MKKLMFSILGVTAAAVLAADVKVTTSTGTIHEYAPGSTFVLKETSGPVTYRYGKEVTYITKSGKRLSDDEVRTRVKVGIPASVHYTTEGDDRVISRVELDDD
jgi:hypothetical protein